MNDLITAATSGLFVEVGKVIEHMKAQASRIADLERQLAEASAPAVEQPIGHISKGMLEQLRERLGVSGYVQSGRTEEFPVALYTAPQAADTDKVREALKLAIRQNSCDMLMTGEEIRKCEAALHSMAAQAPVHEVPEGWRLVPAAITEAMHVAAVKAIIRSTGNDDCPPNVWRAMLAAAPLPAAPVQQTAAIPASNKEQA